MAVDAGASSPYVGFRPFTEHDSHLFFGRDHETGQLLSLITARPVVLLYSQSGAGKSSLLHAGIIPGLNQYGFQVLPTVRAGGRIRSNAEVADVTNRYVFNALSTWDLGRSDHRELAQMTLPNYLERMERPADALGDSPLRVAIWDQFEELFTLRPERWREREDFFMQLAAALQADPLLRVVLCLREEYIAQMDPYAPLLPDRLRARLRLQPMGRDAALGALTAPLRATGMAFVSGVAEQLVEDLLKVKSINPQGETIETVGEYVEPIQLQVVAATLWKGVAAKKTTVITKQDLQRFDVTQALSVFYDDGIRQVAEEVAVQEEKLRDWFEHKLITPAGTRGTVFHDNPETAGLTNAAIHMLEQLHLIRAEFRAGAHWYELSHDRLIQPIQFSNEQWRKNARPRGWRKFFASFRRP